ncbi:hypothetical protein LTR17_005117 [Elasticomyces elasticus]|nr:hypothetical protein LTR17_005117 [Elasticomyces elasticus]
MSLFAPSSLISLSCALASNSALTNVTSSLSSVSHFKLAWLTFAQPHSSQRIAEATLATALHTRSAHFSLLDSPFIDIDIARAACNQRYHSNGDEARPPLTSTDTMPSLDMLLTWVVRVDTGLLGARLQAYINLLPTTHTLRLCNRFGTGDDVHIKRLPVEIVTEIESYLIEAERDNTDFEWFPYHLCFAGLCEPIDHCYSEEELGRLHTHYTRGSRKSKDESAVSGTPVARLTTAQRAKLNQCMTDDYCMEEEIMPGIHEWRNHHEFAKNEWTDLVGEPGGSDRGFFTKNMELIRTHFGLNAWLSHTPSPVENDFHAGDASLDTVAYLTLPTTAATTKYEPRRLAGLECTVRLPTENVYELAISPPERPSEKSLARFARALKILGLEAWPLNWRHDLVDGKVQEDKKNVDSDGSSVSSKAEGPPKGWKENTGPALRLLVSNRDDSAPEEGSG